MKVWWFLLLVGCGSEGGDCRTVEECCAKYHSCGVDGFLVPDLGTAQLVPGQPTAACQRYLRCSTTVQPASAAALLQAYGPNGSCWTSTADVAQTCANACQAGLGQLHNARPSDPDCAICAGDAECSGGTPACGPTGTCVACTTDQHCGGNLPACDVGTHTCVGCTGDAQCGGRGCNLAKHECYECGSDSDCTAGLPSCVNHVCTQCSDASQCKSGQCNGDHTCCVPMPACQGLFGLITYQCGDSDDGCGHTTSCGTCTKGQCSNNLCSNLGVKCTVGDDTCVSENGERCLWNSRSKDYRCAAPYGEGNPCGMSASDCQGDYLTCEYNRTPKVCVQICLSDAECIGSKKCQPTSGTMISMSSPGECR